MVPVEGINKIWKYVSSLVVPDIYINLEEETKRKTEIGRGNDNFTKKYWNYKQKRVSVDMFFLMIQSGAREFEVKVFQKAASQLKIYRRCKKIWSLGQNNGWGICGDRNMWKLK